MAARAVCIGELQFKIEFQPRVHLRALELGGNPRIKAETLAAIRARLGAPSDATPFDDAGRTGVFLASSADKGEL